MGSPTTSGEQFDFDDLVDYDDESIDEEEMEETDLSAEDSYYRPLSEY